MGSLDTTGADKYFKVGNHPGAALWNDADASERTAAIAFANRQLERVKGAALVTPSSESSHIPPREDYALYEQAHHVLRSNPYRANAENGGAKWDLTAEDGRESTQPRTMRQLVKDVIYWMGWNDIQIVRG